jgi:hypothetical protein
MRRHRTSQRGIAATARGAVVGAINGEIVAVLALLLWVFGTGATSDGPAVAQIAGLGDALELLGAVVEVLVRIVIHVGCRRRMLRVAFIL